MSAIAAAIAFAGLSIARQVAGGVPGNKPLTRLLAAWHILVIALIITTALGWTQ